MDATPSTPGSNAMAQKGSDKFTAGTFKSILRGGGIFGMGMNERGRKFEQFKNS